MYFFLNPDVQTSKRYALSKVMEFTSAGIYDSFTSYFWEQLQRLPLAGNYQITTEGRPDLYAYDIYQDTSYWEIILIYNNVALMSDLAIGVNLKYPSIADLENLFFRLKGLQSTLGADADA